ncbi:MAG: serine protein kinase RIO [Candidatus Bathyarchaeia archaeon]
MEKEEKLIEKLQLREKRYITEQLMKEKRSEEMEALEEVFDKSTLMIIYRMLNQGILQKIFGVVKSGKESRVYWGKSREGDVAVKIYLTASKEFRKGMLTYIEGDPRFKKVSKETRALIYLWAKKEFKNLQLAYAAKVNVPKPITVEGNVLIMKFIGKAGEPAPLLKDIPPEKPAKTYNELLNYIRLLYVKAKLVHGDISEYNIMVWKEKPVLFDFAQAVSISHPMAYELLYRDVKNLNSYFRKLGVKTINVDNFIKKVVEKFE